MVASFFGPPCILTIPKGYNKRLKYNSEAARDSVIVDTVERLVYSESRRRLDDRAYFRRLRDASFGRPKT